MASLINKEPYIGGLSWGAARQVDLHTFLPNLKVYTETCLNSVVSHILSRRYQRHCTSQDYVLVTVPTVGMVGRMYRVYIPRTEKEWKPAWVG